MSLNPHLSLLFRTIAEKGGIKPLIRLTIESPEAVRVESVAALANLAVNDDNEIAIVSQACRALRNLSVCSNNRKIILENDGVDLLEQLANSSHDRIRRVRLARNCLEPKV
eukprot:g8075.t1